MKTAFSGQEQRNQNWSKSRGKWTISVKTPAPAQFPGPGGGEGPRRQSFVDLLTAFHQVVKGRGDAFRLLDLLDYKGINQQLATVAGQVQLVKNYVIGGRTYQRVITKPITASVVDFQGNSLANTVFLHGTTTPVTADYTTGIVTGQSAGTAVDFQFHCPVRFDVDELPIQVEESAVGAAAPVVSINGVQLFEVLPPNY